MIHFFRRIRQKFLAENRFNKYVVYAIGEILLVVIGILLALQINTWNQERINRNEEKRIYFAIAKKMQLNQMQLNLGKGRYEKVIDGAKSLLSHSHDPQTTLSMEEYAIHLNNITKVFLLGKSNKTHIYDEIIASGQMSLLRSEKLRNRLTGLKVQMELLEAYEDRQTHFVDAELTPFLNVHADRLWIYTNVASSDTSHLDNLHQINLSQVDHRASGTYYDDNLFQSREFSNLLFELIRRTTKLLPIYNRIEADVEGIYSITTD